MVVHGFTSALVAPPRGPYSAAVSAGHLVFVSAQLPFGPGEEPGGDAAGQARSAFAHLAHQLRATGLGLESVAALTVYLTDPDDLTAVDDVCREHFSEPYPARSVVGAAWLPGGALLQVAAVAIRY
jgi:2-iminobutanoate/2-iminopropanoate deaminase